MVAPAVDGIDLFKIAGRSRSRVDSQFQDERDIPCPAAVL